MTVELPHRRAHDHPQFLEAIRRDAGRLCRQLFGSTGRARVVHVIVDTRERWVLQCQVEGHPVHDPRFRAAMTTKLTAHYEHGFGPTATVTVAAGMLAGDAQDGTPPDQWIILPSLTDLLEAEGVH